MGQVEMRMRREILKISEMGYLSIKAQRWMSMIMCETRARCTGSCCATTNVRDGPRAGPQLEILTMAKLMRILKEVYVVMIYFVWINLGF